MTFLREETCGGCDRKVEIYDLEIIGGSRKGETIEWKKGCVCDEIELANKSIKSRRKLVRDKMEDFFSENSLINKDLQKATFENYLPENKSQSFAKRTAQRYVEVFDLDKPRNLSFHGTFGIGKSHLAKAICDGVMAKETKENEGKQGKHGYNVIFISVPKLLRKIKSTFDKDSDINEDEMLRYLEETDLLVLDDLGAENATHWSYQVIFDIVDSRQGKNTIYTTNYMPDDLIEKLGERNFSRVVNQDTNVIEIDGDNHRLKRFRGDE